eukprot:4914505-Prorocentrum_lima.AAC.1
MAVFGDYEGGKLRVWPTDTRRGPASALSPQDAITIDTHHTLLLFDGSKAHQALPATGKRHSVLWYTPAKWAPLRDT